MHVSGTADSTLKLRDRPPIRHGLAALGLERLTFG
jgi:hypothetical protein